MSNEPIRIGIIGVGQIGKHHVNNYSKVPGAQLVAIADVNEAEARRVAEQFNIPHVYTNYQDLLARDDIQAVDVALHNNLHMPISVAAFQSGKHVYCEKPMAGAYIDAERMLYIARECGMKLSIQLSSLFSDETRAAKYLIDEGRLGKLYHARSYGHRRRGRPYVDGYGSQFFVQKDHASGGALYDMGVYHIAQILYLLGNPDVRTISGKIYQETDMDSTRRERSGYNVEEIGMGFVRLANNISMDILEAWAVHLDKFDGSVVLGSQGGVRLDPFGFFHSVGHLDFNVDSNMGGFNWRQHSVQEIGDVYDSAQHHWVAALQGRVDLLPTAEVALNTMLISEGIYLSDKLGREVTPDEVREHSVSTALKV